MRRPEQPLCPTLVEGSDCIEIRGTGSGDDLYRAYYKLSDDPANALVASPSGLRLNIPSQIARRPAAKLIAFDDQSYDTQFPVPFEFDDALYDTSAMFDSSDNALVIARTGWWALGTFASYDSSGDDIIAHIGITVNDVRRVAAEGAKSFSVSAVPPYSSTIYTQMPLEAGDRIKVLSEGSVVDGAYIRQDRFLFAHFRGD